jgi:hypothetical protein
MPMSEANEHRNDDLCAECEGKCCYVYGPQSNLTWERLHNDHTHLHGGGYYPEYGTEPLQQKLAPTACEYLSNKGCIITWEKRPAICKSFRCGLWRDLEFRRY